MSIGKVILNFNEFIPLLSSPGINLDVLLEAIENLTEQLKKEDKMAMLTSVSINMSIDMPAIARIYSSQHKFKSDSYLTGITIGATGYNTFDTVTIEINGEALFQTLTLKEMVQHKTFAHSIFVPKGSVMNVNYHNKECHSKYFICDIDFMTDVDFVTHKFDVPAIIPEEPEEPEGPDVET